MSKDLNNKIEKLETDALEKITGGHEADTEKQNPKKDDVKIQLVKVPEDPIPHNKNEYGNLSKVKK